MSKIYYRLAKCLATNTKMNSLGILAREVLLDLKALARTLPDRLLINRYMTEHPTRKLQIGCGNNILQGWLNTDRSLVSPAKVQVNAAKHLSFQDESFDFIFAEHILEHVPYNQGQQLLSDCFRVLKPGGVLRVCVPDLDKILKSFHSGEPAEYVKHMIGDQHIVHLPNQAFREWGHQHLDNESSMCARLEKCGFKDISTHDFGKSKRPEFNNIDSANLAADSQERISKQYETLAMEAVK